MLGEFLLCFILRFVGPEVGQEILEGGADAAPEAVIQVWFLLWHVGGYFIWLYIEIHGGYVALHLFLIWCFGDSVIWLRIEVHGGYVDGDVDVDGIIGVHGKHPPVSLDVDLVLCQLCTARCLLWWTWWSGVPCRGGGCMTVPGAGPSATFMWVVAALAKEGLVIAEASSDALGSR